MPPLLTHLKLLYIFLLSKLCYKTPFQSLIFDFLNFSIYIFLKAPVVDAPEVDITNIKLSEPPNYKKGDKLATRQAYGTGKERNLEK